MDWNADSGIDFKVNKRILTNNYSINFKNIILIVLILFEINWDKLEYSNKYSKAWTLYVDSGIDFKVNKRILTNIY